MASVTPLVVLPLRQCPAPHSPTCAPLHCRFLPLLLQLIDYNFMASLIAAFGRHMPDFKRHAASSVPAAATAAAAKGRGKAGASSGK